jgi:Squalene-hopene cyclase C-terminal domain
MGGIMHIETQHRTLFLATAVVMLGSTWHGAGLLAQERPEPAKIKGAIAKALPLLQKGAAGHVDKRTCFSCHHQALPVLALSIARQRGFEVDEAIVKEQLSHTHHFIAEWARRNPDRKSFGGGQADTAGHTLLTLELGGWKGDETTSAVVDYLLLRDKNLGHWRSTSNRPPTEASPFTTTALALRGLKAFGSPEQKQRIDERVDAARAWLLKTTPKDNEDRVYRLWGLRFAAAEEDDIRQSVDDLQASQQKDGGWAQTAKLTSDAYATGSALAALHLAGKLSVDDSVYQRGLDFLIKDQKPDGSWHVRSRSKPFQTYFETGFPHEKDQWISCSASSWATAALLLACAPEAKK